MRAATTGVYQQTRHPVRHRVQRGPHYRQRPETQPVLLVGDLNFKGDTPGMKGPLPVGHEVGVRRFHQSVPVGVSPAQGRQLSVQHLNGPVLHHNRVRLSTTGVNGRCLWHHWGRDPVQKVVGIWPRPINVVATAGRLRAPLGHLPWGVAAENTLPHLACFSDTAGMQLPRWLVKVIDPPTGYMQDRSPRPAGGPVFRGGAIFGPGVEGGARQATPEELRRMRAEAETSRGAARPSRHAEVDPDVVRAAGNDIIEQGTTTVRADGREMTARIVTFWHGDSLLVIVVHGPGRDQSSTTRIPRKLTPSDLPMLVAYLTDALQAR